MTACQVFPDTTSANPDWIAPPGEPIFRRIDGPLLTAAQSRESAMKFLSAATLSASLVFLSPAVAQDGADTGTDNQTSTSMTMAAEARDKLRDSLQKAGFTAVQIIDTAYLVQATTPGGEIVLMTVNPMGTGSFLTLPNPDQGAGAGADTSNTGNAGPDSSQNDSSSGGTAPEGSN